MVDLPGPNANLLGPQPTLLPEDPELLAGLEEGLETRDLAARFPASSLPWALLAEQALADSAPIEAYAFARTGYHRGLDALRRNGWRGVGPIPWAHAGNQGFLRALNALGQAATLIHEDEEAARIAIFLTDSDPSAPKTF